MSEMERFFTGLATEAHTIFGAHALEQGYRFTVWAPGARQVFVVGDFNNWRYEDDPMEKIEPAIYSREISSAREGQYYKYAILTTTGEVLLKADPYARAAECRPNTASCLMAPCTFAWQDGDWLAARPAHDGPQPINIYELHLGSWRRGEDGRFLSYAEIADELIPYVKSLHYTHVELMPVMAHPLDASWGYQITGYYAVTARFGVAADFKRLIDRLHQAGIGVILDWAPAHFPKDAHGLAAFTGQPVYEYADIAIGERRIWGTLVFNYGKAEVRSFLLSNAFYWVEEFHADGLRCDAVSSMIYRDYDQDQYSAGRQTDVMNPDALDFLRELNRAMHEKHPQVLMFAEESSDFEKVTASVEAGGLGFSYKWDLGWMHDTLDYFGTDYAYRPYQHQRLTFNMLYAFKERFMLPLSHDEVVHGKRALIEKMPGDYWRKFASYRCLLAYMLTRPGAKLLFMGGEFGQFTEWHFYETLDWYVLQYDMHQKLKLFVEVLNGLYRDNPVFWRDDRDWSGYRWLAADDAERSIFSYLRMAPEQESALVILNMLPTPAESFVIEVDQPGCYEIVLDSDAACFGGSDYDTGISDGLVYSRKEGASEERPYSLTFDLPPLACLILRHRAD